MERDTPLTLKETIDVLTEIYEQHGDLEVQVYTQDGDWYKIWGKDCITVNKYTNGTKFVEIG